MVTAPARGHNAIDPAWPAAPAGASAILRHELRLRNPATSMWDTVRNDLPSTRASDNHSGLEANTKCAYRLRAVIRAADNGLGNWSTFTFANAAE